MLNTKNSASFLATVVSDPQVQDKRKGNNYKRRKNACKSFFDKTIAETDHLGVSVGSSTTVYMSHHFDADTLY